MDFCFISKFINTDDFSEIGKFWPNADPVRPSGRRTTKRNTTRTKEALLRRLWLGLDTGASNRPSDGCSGNDEDEDEEEEENGR